MEKDTIPVKAIVFFFPQGLTYDVFLPHNHMKCYVFISRLFRELCGMSPKQYLTDLRFRYAKELLTGDYSSIADVAYKAGFSDPCHFADSFRRTFDMTPGEYRRSKQNGV